MRRTRAQVRKAEKGTREGAGGAKKLKKLQPERQRRGGTPGESWVAGEESLGPDRGYLENSKKTEREVQGIERSRRNCKECPMSRLIAYTELGGESWNTYDSRWG